MFQKTIFLSVLFLGLMFASQQNCFAQEKNKEELKAEREQLKADLKSKNSLKTTEKLDKIAPVGGTMADLVTAVLSPLPAQINSEVAEPLKKLVGNKEARVINKPAPTSLNSVDGLINSGASLLSVVVATNAVLSEYKVAIVETADGEVDITKFKANAKDYAAVMPLLVQAGIDAAKAAKQIENVQADVKGLNPMQAGPTIKASNWAIDAVNVSVAKISENTKLLQSLVNSLKASGNF